MTGQVRASTTAAEWGRVKDNKNKMGRDKWHGIGEQGRQGQEHPQASPDHVDYARMRHLETLALRLEALHGEWYDG